MMLVLTGVSETKCMESDCLPCGVEVGGLSNHGKGFYNKEVNMSEEQTKDSKSCQELEYYGRQKSCFICSCNVQGICIATNKTIKQMYGH